MLFTFWISKRLKLNGSENTANATGSTIAVIGVAFAIIVMAATLAIVSGFKNQITARIMAFEPQISVLPPFDYESGMSAPNLVVDDKLRQIVEAEIPVSSASMRYTQPVVLKTDDDFAAAYVQAYDSGHDYSFERANLVKGEWPDFSSDSTRNTIAISSSMASDLMLDTGDKVYAYFFVNDAVKARRFTIGAIYNTGFSDYDKVTAFGNLKSMQSIGNSDSVSATQYAIAIKDPDKIEELAAQLQTKFLDLYKNGEIGELYPVDNVRHVGSVFFNWLDLLNTNVIVIFILMACVAAFTLISSMFILILDRIPTIGLLRALGSTKKQIRNIFALLAMKTVGLGIIIGDIIAMALLLAQAKWHIIKLNPEMYYLPHVPIEINWWWMLIMNIAVAVIAWALLILPAKAAANVSPASTMRFE